MEFPKVLEEIFDSRNEKLEKLAQLFPSIIKDDQVDFKALKEELGQVQEVGKEKYGISWPGKQMVKAIANETL